MNRLLSAGLAGVLAATLAMPAAAHTGHAGDAMFLQGLLHPLTGIDHLLTMVAVGIWAAQNGGRALWLLPTAFITMLSVGALLGMTGIELPAVEAGIAASVSVLGLLVLLNRRVPVAAAAVLVGAFAVLHGHALRWSPFPGQYCGWNKLGSGPCHAANLIPARIPAGAPWWASAGVRPPSAECGRSAL
ncbi:HupE/UreJ family protein [Azospirillum endophyticum]